MLPQANRKHERDNPAMFISVYIFVMCIHINKLLYSCKYIMYVYIVALQMLDKVNVTVRGTHSTAQGSPSRCGLCNELNQHEATAASHVYLIHYHNH